MSAIDRAAGRRYQALLGALLLLLVAYPAVLGPGGSPILAKLLLTIVFLSGIWVVFSDGRLRALAVVLAVPPHRRRVDRVWVARRTHPAD